MLSTEQGKAYFVAGGSLQVNEMLVDGRVYHLVLSPSARQITAERLVESNVGSVPDLHRNLVLDYVALKGSVRGAIAA
jgi:hypothetical protein